MCATEETFKFASSAEAQLLLTCRSGGSPISFTDTRPRASISGTAGHQPRKQTLQGGPPWAAPHVQLTCRSRGFSAICRAEQMPGSDPAGADQIICRASVQAELRQNHEGHGSCWPRRTQINARVDKTLLSMNAGHRHCQPWAAARQ